MHVWQHLHKTPDKEWNTIVTWQITTYRKWEQKVPLTTPCTGIRSRTVRFAPLPYLIIACLCIVFITLLTRDGKRYRLLISCHIRHPAKSTILPYIDDTAHHKTCFNQQSIIVNPLCIRPAASSFTPFH